MGYNDENNFKGMCLARKKIRNILLKYNLDKKYPLLKKKINKCHQYNLLRLLFKKPRNTTLILNLQRFSKEASVQKAWKIFKKYQTLKIKNLFHLFRDEARRLIKFLDKSPQSIKKIILIPNFLDAYWRGYGIRVGRIGYIVVGPGAEKNHGELIRHELLHLLTPALWIPRRIIAYQQPKSLPTLCYASPSILNREYVVRSLNLLYKSAVLKIDTSEVIKHEEKDFPYIKKALAFVKIEKEKGRL